MITFLPFSLLLFSVLVILQTGISQASDGGYNRDFVHKTLSPHLTETKPFYIHGWRWHTLSLVRDAGRLEKLAVKLMKSNSKCENIEKAAHHVIDFNMKGLHSVESELFFPWIRTKIEYVGNEVGQALECVLKEIEEERYHLENLGYALKEQAKIASSSESDTMKRHQAISNVAQMSADMTSRTRRIMETEENILVPIVGEFISAGEQKSFNSKVIRKLGLLNSRLHLVGMYDAVWEDADIKERDLFIDTIPYLPRAMIPRWKRLLYQPQAGMLDL